MAEFTFSGRRHTPESRAKMSEARKGKNHISDEGRRRISEKRQQRAREARELGLPENYRCSPCSKREGRSVYKPLREFTLAKKTLKSGEVVFYPSPRCKACNRERIRAHRESLSPEERRRRQRRYDRTRLRKRKEARKSLAKDERLPKGPFLEFFFDYRDRTRANFLVHEKGESSGGFASSQRKGSSFDGVFDSALFASHCGLTKTQYQTLTRIARDSAVVETVSLNLVETVLISIDMEHKLAELYPVLPSK
jgi:hypothetical protein